MLVSRSSRARIVGPCNSWITSLPEVSGPEVLLWEVCRWKHGGEGDAVVLFINGDVEEVPAGTAGFVVGVANDAVTGAMGTGQLFDVDMQEFGRRGMF